jgi:hypothetical protein
MANNNESNKPVALKAEFTFGNNTAEKDPLLLTYFYESPEALALLKHRKLLAVGRKGSGKSALRIWLEDQLRREDKVVVLSQAEFESLKMKFLLGEKSEENFKLAAKAVWHAGIMMEALRACDENYIQPNDGETIKNDLALRQIIKDSQAISTSVVDRFVSFLKSVKKLGIAGLGEIELDENQRPTRDAFTRLLHISQTPHVKSFCERHLRRRGMTILVDDVDADWVSTKENAQFILALIEVLSGLRTNIQGLSATLLISDDVYRKVIDGYRHRDKLKDDVLKLRWSADHLKAMVAKRICYHLDKEMSDQDAWDYVFPGTVASMPIVQYVVQHTIQRPRDVLDILRLALDHAKARQPLRLEEMDFVRATQENASELLDNIDAEFSSLYPRFAQVTKELLNEMQTQLNVVEFKKTIETRLISFDQTLVDVVDKAWATGGEPESLLHVFFELGIVGIGRSREEARWSFLGHASDHTQDEVVFMNRAFDDILKTRA